MLLLYCKQFYTSLDKSVQLEMLLCSWNWFYASLDRSVWQEMLLCFWNQFYASLDGSVQQEMLLCFWNQFYASLDGSVREEKLLCLWNQFYASLDGSVRQEMLLCVLTIGRNSIWILPPKSPLRYQEPSMEHHGSSWNKAKRSKAGEKGWYLSLGALPRLGTGTGYVSDHA